VKVKKNSAKTSQPRLRENLISVIKANVVYGRKTMMITILLDNNSNELLLVNSIQYSSVVISVFSVGLLICF